MLIWQWRHRGAGTIPIHRVIEKYLPRFKDKKLATYSAEEIRVGLKRAYDELGKPELFDAIEPLIKMKR